MNEKGLGSRATHVREEEAAGSPPRLDEAFFDQVQGEGIQDHQAGGLDDNAVRRWAPPLQGPSESRKDADLEHVADDEEENREERDEGLPAAPPPTPPQRDRIRAVCFFFRPGRGSRATARGHHPPRRLLSTRQKKRGGPREKGGAAILFIRRSAMIIIKIKSLRRPVHRNAWV